MIGVPAKGPSPQPRFSRRSPQHDLAESGQFPPLVGLESSPESGRSVVHQRALVPDAKVFPTAHDLRCKG